MTYEQARDETFKRIEDWAIWLATLPGDNLDMPSKQSYTVVKDDEDKLPTLYGSSIDDAEYLERNVMTVWRRRLDSRQERYGEKISRLLMLTITSGHHKSVISRMCDVPEGSYDKFLVRGVKETQQILFPDVKKVA